MNSALPYLLFNDANIFKVLTAFFAATTLYFFFKWKDRSYSKKIGLDNLNAESELIYMRNQLNPHFLFNSFNSLIGMMEEGKHEAGAKMVEDLSDFYRIILDYGKRNLVSIEEEFQMVSLFVDIINQRFDDNIHLTISDISDKIELPPLTLQLLIENAIKHNEFNDENPLYISIGVRDNQIFIKNNRRRKNYKVKSTGNGLLNINKRFELLINKSIVINDNEQYFEVLLPII